MKNLDLKEYAIMHWDEKLGKKYILTNAFSDIPLRAKVAHNSVWNAYEFYFNTCDRLNHFLGRYYWPYRRNGWQTNYDSFCFAALMHNIFALYHEHLEIPVNLNNKEFCSKLSIELLNYVNTQ